MPFDEHSPADGHVKLYRAFVARRKKATPEAFDAMCRKVCEEGRPIPDLIELLQTEYRLPAEYETSLLNQLIVSMNNSGAEDDVVFETLGLTVAPFELFLYHAYFCTRHLEVEVQKSLLVTTCAVASNVGHTHHIGQRGEVVSDIDIYKSYDWAAYAASDSQDIPAGTLGAIAGRAMVVQDHQLVLVIAPLAIKSINAIPRTELPPEVTEALINDQVGYLWGAMAVAADGLGLGVIEFDGKPHTCGDMFLKSMACRTGTNIAVVDKPPERFETPTTKETITRLCVYGALAFAAFAIRQKLLR